MLDKYLGTVVKIHKEIEKIKEERVSTPSLKTKEKYCTEQKQKKKDKTNEKNLFL